MKKLGLVFVALFCGININSKAGNQEFLTPEQAGHYILENISPKGTSPGSVAASPSRREPNYFYHWVRDAALVMGAVDLLHQELGRQVEGLLFNYSKFERSLQLTHNRSGGLGEPKFHMDGRAYDEDWGRPQNDGPALRAITLIGVANRLLDSGDQAKNPWLELLYSKSGSSIIKDDLYFVAEHFRERSFDIWEEDKGEHFFNYMVYRRALLDGADLASRVGDETSANYFKSVSFEVVKKIDIFLQARPDIIPVTLNREYGAPYKTSELDAAVVIAVNIADRHDGFLPLNHPKLKNSVEQMERRFQDIFPINSKSKLAPGIGRYPEDRYTGYHTGGEGNPWFITTHAFAEYYCKLGDRQKGRSFLDRAATHRDQEDNRMAEQMNRHTGVMQGAENLTWSYASYVTAYKACYP